MFKFSEWMLSKMKANLTKIKANWALEKERMESEVVKAKRQAIEVMDKYKASESLTKEKARAVVDFQKSEEFYALCQDFGEESYKEGFYRESLSVG